MTTKAQERKALEQIRKIVEGLGENSYLSMAFEGCFEIAEENIDNDFGLSMKQKVENLVEKLDKKTEEANNYKRAHDTLKERYNTLRQDCEDRINRQEYTIATFKAERDCARNETSEKTCTINDMKIQLAEQEQTILELKAKLFDYMIKEAH